MKKTVLAMALLVFWLAWLVSADVIFSLDPIQQKEKNICVGQWWKYFEGGYSFNWEWTAPSHCFGIDLGKDTAFESSYGINYTKEDEFYSRFVRKRRLHGVVGSLLLLWFFILRFLWKKLSDI